ncbi:hypothetical protein CJ255_16585 [Candidatus Viridilinea mediisalina]|uniref:Phosphoadenosine phosphosulphate reductase domain-containing protein n=2 Tax=Candidatus Viridilinea mediisalina TaxID=2024553 RepID=A0A2A6RFM8_9CHLR|nr:hypothetical protein CJ255_16585 [Candidatus Viridilinea mediisalina]
MLLRWLLHPETRDFHLNQMIVIIAQVGEEFAGTKRLVEQIIFPLLTQHRIRTVQVARAGPSDKDGIVVLSDTRAPSVCHTEGAWRLGDHLMRDGTAPQYANGRHFCAQRFKGWPIAKWVKQELRGRRYRSILGYHAEEPKRAAKAADYADIQRTHEFPLIAWGWGRAEVLAYVRDVTGEEWEKSCCGFCPFTGGRVELVERHLREPEQGARALLMELLSRSMNPRFGLYPSGKPLRATLEAAGCVAAITQFQRMILTHEWAVYRVRRIYREKAPLVDRSVAIIATGDRQAMLDHLRILGQTEVVGGIERVYFHRRPEGLLPSVEAFYVAAPHIIAKKEKKSFATRWHHHTDETRHGVSQIALF